MRGVSLTRAPLGVTGPEVTKCWGLKGCGLRAGIEVRGGREQTEGADTELMRQQSQDSSDDARPGRRRSSRMPEPVQAVSQLHNSAPQGDTWQQQGTFFFVTWGRRVL